MVAPAHRLQEGRQWASLCRCTYPTANLSPQTCAVLTGAMLPVWATAARRVRTVVRRRNVPLLALGAAFSFLVIPKAPPGASSPRGVRTTITAGPATAHRHRRRAVARPVDAGTAPGEVDSCGRDAAGLRASTAGSVRRR